jgi:formylglycine-generating enzyme required for sulfatase activity
LTPGRYHVEVSAEGFETQRRWIDLKAGQKAPFRFELAEIKTTRPSRFEPSKIKLSKPVWSPKESITNSIGMTLVIIPAGSFTMGSRLSPEEVASRYGRGAEDYKDEQPPHPVEITKPFYMQTTVVTQGQWKQVMGNNPSRFKACGDNCPVEQVSWEDAQAFIQKLNEMEGTAKYRLPTEAEWEYACRATTTTLFFTGDCISSEQANYMGQKPGKNCPKGKDRQKTVKVGSFTPNAWGLFDMHGNVYEWCQDWYGAYPSGRVLDPKGPAKGEKRVLRGGAYNFLARDARSAVRFSSDPYNRVSVIGFRVARDY